MPVPIVLLEDYNSFCLSILPGENTAGFADGLAVVPYPELEVDTAAEVCWLLGCVVAAAVRVLLVLSWCPGQSQILAAVDIFSVVSTKQRYVPLFCAYCFGIYSGIIIKLDFVFCVCCLF